MAEMGRGDAVAEGRATILGHCREFVKAGQSGSSSAAPGADGGTGAGKQPPRCPQEEDEADEGGDGEVQGGERGHGQEAPG